MVFLRRRERVRARGEASTKRARHAKVYDIHDVVVRVCDAKATMNALARPLVSLESKSRLASSAGLRCFEAPHADFSARSHDSAEPLVA